MKKCRTLFLLAILIAGTFFVAIPALSLNNSINTLSETLDTNQVVDTPPVAPKITQTDPRGYLTGKITYNGYSVNTLMIDVEFEITTTDTLNILVMAELYDRSFQRRYYDSSNNGWNIDNGYSFYGNSSLQSFTSGTYSVTVHFNCTRLRALKLGGPYFITRVQLANGTDYSNYQVFNEEFTDDWDNKPLFVIPKVFDIYTFDEPEENGYILLGNETLTSDYTTLNIDVSFQSFNFPGDEDYYLRLVLRDSGGSTIGNWGQAFYSIHSNELTMVTLRIPSEFLGAFDFGGSSYPTLWFEEVTVMPYHRYRGPLEISNMSYKGSAYSTSSIYVPYIPSVTTYSDGTFDFGDITVTENRTFRILSTNPDEILDLAVDRRMPWDTNPPNFQIWYFDGWGRSRGLWYQDPYISWEEWVDDEYNNIRTQIVHFKMHIGRHMGPWFFHITYPDEAQADKPSQGLAVSISKTDDTSSPAPLNVASPSGLSYKQFYGIPVYGTIQEYGSAVILYQILSNEKVLLNYRPFEMYWGDPPLGEEFSFVWFTDRLYTFDITIRAYDMTYRSTQMPLTITIDPGTKPSPESTITKGLEWLKNSQNFDGSWEYIPGETWGNPGMTALAALCFIQAGLTDQQVTIDAIDYLRNQFYYDNQVPGKHPQSIYMNTYMTSMAAITLIAYNATLPAYDSGLSALIDDAIEWLVKTQNIDQDPWGVTYDKPWYGGWRYGDDHESSDLSVSQWVILALSTYEDFNPDGLAKYPDFDWSTVDTFVRRCRGGYTNDTGHWNYDGGFSYTPSTETWREGGSGSYGSMTAAGIWGLYLSGSAPDDPDIISALDWINNTDQIVGGNPHYGRSFEYYWYLSASKAFLMAGRASDQWWYDDITEYLNTHMIYNETTAAYWDNTVGGEPPVYATVLAILSQQVFYGNIPTHALEVTLESADGSAIYLWNSTMNVGYNYTTGVFETSPNTDYSGLLIDTQKVSILSPSKGEYNITLFPAAGRNGFPSQTMVLRARALTESGHIIRYKSHLISYNYLDNYPQVLQYKMILTTISGLDIHFLWDGYEFFDHSVNFDTITAPSYVELNEEFDIIVKMTNVGPGTIPSGIFFMQAEDFMDDSQGFSNWAVTTQKTFSFHFDPTGFPAGIRTIVFGILEENTTPLLIRVKVQIGNRVPEGELHDLSSVLSGTTTISWEASDPDGDVLSFDLILIRPDGSEDTLLYNSNEFSYEFDTTAYPDDSGYRIKLRISDGTDTTELTSDFFEIKNRTETTGEEDGAPHIGAPGFELIFSLLALSIILMYIRRRK